MYAGLQSSLAHYRARFDVCMLRFFGSLSCTAKILSMLLRSGDLVVVRAGNVLHVLQANSINVCVFFWCVWKKKHPISRLLCQTATTKFTLMLYVCFNHAPELDVPDSSFQAGNKLSKMEDFSARLKNV